MQLKTKSEFLLFPRDHRWMIISGFVIATLSAAVYAFFCPCLNERFVSTILLHPTKVSGQVAQMKILGGISGTEVFFTPTGGSSKPQLNGWFYEQANSHIVVLFNHGNTGNVSTRRWKQENILTTGASLFVYDYRGFGRSDGIPTLHGVVEDGLAAYDYLVNVKNFKPKNIVLYGESFGSCVLVEIAKLRTCGGLIVQSGCTSAESLCKEQLPILNVYPSFLFFRPSLDNLTYLQGAHPPLLIVAGAKDEIVPPHHASELFRQARPIKTLVMLPCSTHNDFAIDSKQFSAELKKFLLSLETEN